MITISQAVSIEMEKHPFITEALAEGLINVSSLARKFKPVIEKELRKPIKEGAIIMALNRYAPQQYLKAVNAIKNNIYSIGNITVRSGLSDFTFSNSDSFSAKQTEFLKHIENHKNVFCTFTQGVHEVTLVVASSMGNEVNKIFTGEQVVSVKEKLASVTLQLPKSNTEVFGVYYYILKEIAWQGINLVEVISTANEFTLILLDNEADKAFSLLMRMKSS